MRGGRQNPSNARLTYRWSRLTEDVQPTKLEYAEDVDILDGAIIEAWGRLARLGACVENESGLKIEASKSFGQPEVKVHPTTPEDIEAKGFKFLCHDCNRKIPFSTSAKDAQQRDSHWPSANGMAKEDSTATASSIDDRRQMRAR